MHFCTWVWYFDYDKDKEKIIIQTDVGKIITYINKSICLDAGSKHTFIHVISNHNGYNLYLNILKNISTNIYSNLSKSPSIYHVVTINAWIMSTSYETPD